MAYNKIDNKDITVQLESNRVDVWVPDGVAMPDRTYKPEGASFWNPKRTVAVSPSKDEIQWIYNTEIPIPDWYVTWKGKLKEKSNLVDVTVNGGKDTNAKGTPVYSRDVGPICMQNKIPIPVVPGDQISMAGSCKVRQTGAPTPQDENGNFTGLAVRFDLWAVGYEEDEYGEESEIVLNMSSFTQNLQSTPPLFGSVGSGWVTYILPNIDYMTVPYGCDRVFLTVSYVSLNTLQYISVGYGQGSNGWFTAGFSVSEFAVVLPGNELRILTKKNEADHVVVNNSLSKTGATFKNRAFFENVWPLFNYFNVLNSGFSDDFSHWEGVTSGITISTDSPHTASKCVKVINSGQIYGPPIEISPGDKVYMSGWMRNIDFSGPGGLRIQKRIGTTWSDMTSGTVTQNNSQWIKSEIQGIVPNDANAIRLRIAFSGTGTIYVDDIEGAILINDNELTYMGINGVGTSIEIYEWNGSRGALIKADSVSSNVRKTIDISSSTGMVEIVKPGGVSPANMGIQKNNTNQGPIATTTWIPVTGFVVQNSYLGTHIDSGSTGFQVDIAGTIIVNAYLSFDGEPGKYNKGVRVKKNGAVVTDGTFITAFETTGMSGRTKAFSVVPGDIISFEAYSESTNPIQRTILKDFKTHFELTYVPGITPGPDFYIESLIAKSYEDLDEEQNQLENITYTDVVDDVSNIKIERQEADAGVLTVTFCSNNLDPRTNELLQIGKTMRILGRHYGIGNKSKPLNWVGEADYSVVMKARIKRIEVTYDYENEPQITVTAYDGFQKMDSTALGLAYDTIEEYAPALNSSGQVCIVDGVDYTGAQGPMPGELEYFPSTYGDISLIDAMIMTRNTNKHFLFFDRKNRFIYNKTLDSSLKLTFTDGTIPGDLSMGEVKQGIDTDGIINVINVEENLLDKSDLDDRQASSAKPPEQFKPISSKQRTIRYQDDISISAFGEYSKTFQVVRGSGSYSDLANGNFGSTFEFWAKEIVEDFSYPKINISQITAPVKDADTMRMISEIELLDKHWVNYIGETYEINVRKISHDIKPGKWTCVIGYLPENDQTFWN